MLERIEAHWPSRPTAAKGVLVGGLRGWLRLSSRLFQNLVMHIGSAWAVWYGFSVKAPDWIDLATFALFLVLTGLAITAGYHRCLTHNAFACPTWLRVWFAVFGSMAMAAPTDSWVADHHRHHSLSDMPGDVHSPHYDALGRKLGRWRGLWHGHFGWMFTTVHTDRKVWGKALARDRAVTLASRLHYLWVALGLFLPWLFGLLLGGTQEAAISAMLWGGCVRALYVHHAQLYLTSVSHRFGSTPFVTRDGSRNGGALAGLLTFGESWHQNHHRFPNSARIGLRRGEIDFSAWTVEWLERIGLVSAVVRVSPESLQRALGERRP